MEVLFITVLTLCALGVVAAVVLYFVARTFRVDEDPRIDEVEKMLPGANCGGCGFAGCRGIADALVKRDDISSLYCPVGGAACMKHIADYLGKAAPEKEAQVATIRCGGTCAKRSRSNEYDGARSCAVASGLYIGETGCVYGCLGYGDCVTVCAFDAIQVNPDTGLPEVDPDKCTACGACVKACPKKIIELRKKWPKNKAVYVSCVSRDKGAVVMKACKAGCIGCGKCVKVCPFEAIGLENNLAYIDPLKCKLCRKCVNECPTGAIVLENMNPLPREPKPAAAKPAAGTFSAPEQTVVSTSVQPTVGPQEEKAAVLSVRTGVGSEDSQTPKESMRDQSPSNVHSSAHNISASESTVPATGSSVHSSDMDAEEESCKA